MSRKREWRDRAKTKRADVLDFIGAKKRRQTDQNRRVYCDPQMPGGWEPEPPRAA